MTDNICRWCFGTFLCLVCTGSAFARTFVNLMEAKGMDKTTSCVVGHSEKCVLHQIVLHSFWEETCTRMNSFCCTRLALWRRRLPESRSVQAKLVHVWKVFTFWLEVWYFSPGERRIFSVVSRSLNDTSTNDSCSFLFFTLYKRSTPKRIPETKCSWSTVWIIHTCASLHDVWNFILSSTYVAVIYLSHNINAKNRGPNKLYCTKREDTHSRRKGFFESEMNAKAKYAFRVSPFKGQC